MRIYAICSVRNESDIVESLCRYTLLFCDGMIINDSPSRDNTKEIIQKMIAEGLPLYLTECPTNHISMVRIAVERFNADFVLPMDADEFLFCPNGDNPRTVLETLDPETEYHIPWRTFVFTQPPDNNTRFLPSFFPYHRVKEPQQFCKTVVSRNLLQRHNVMFAAGNHSLAYPNPPESPVPVEELSSLAYAHYPLRGIYHAMSKSILMEYDASTDIHRTTEAFQYKAALDTIQRQGILTVDDVKKLSIEYAIDRPLTEPVQLIDDPLTVPFDAGLLTLRYTDYNKDESQFFRTVFSNTHDIIKRQTDNLRNSEAERNKLTGFNRELVGTAIEQAEIIMKLQNEVQELKARKAANSIYSDIITKTINSLKNTGLKETLKKIKTYRRRDKESDVQRVADKSIPQSPLSNYLDFFTSLLYRDTVPHIPDNPAGFFYRNDSAWSGWSHTGGTGSISVNDGIMSIQGIGHIIKDTVVPVFYGQLILIKVRNRGDAARDVGINFHYNGVYVRSMRVGQLTEDWSIVSLIVPEGVNGLKAIYKSNWQTGAGTLEIADLYIGDSLNNTVWSDLYIGDYRNDTAWSGWRHFDGSGSIAVNNGVMSIQGTGRLTKDVVIPVIPGQFIIIKARNTGDAVKDIGVNLHYNGVYVRSMRVGQLTEDWSIVSLIVPEGVNGLMVIYKSNWQTGAGTLEIADLYIGTYRNDIVWSDLYTGDYRNDNAWSGWSLAGGAGSISVNDGVMSIDGIGYFTKDVMIPLIPGQVIQIKARNRGDAAKDMGVNLFKNGAYVRGINVGKLTEDWSILSLIVPEGVNGLKAIYKSNWQIGEGTLEIADLYIGDGSNIDGVTETILTGRRRSRGKSILF